MKEVKKAPLPIRVYQKLKDRLDKARKKDGRSRTNAIEQGIELYVADVEFRMRKGRK